MSERNDGRGDRASEKRGDRPRLVDSRGRVFIGVNDPRAQTPAEIAAALRDAIAEVMDEEE